MKILIHGIGGRMGVEIKKMALEGYKGSEIAAGVDVNPLALDGIPTYTDIYDVVEVGPGGMVDGCEVTMIVKPGDTVLLGKYMGSKIKLDGEEYTIVRQSEILAIIE